MDEIFKVIYLNYLNIDGKKEDVKYHDSIINYLKNIKSICNDKITDLKENPKDKSTEIYNQEKKIKGSKILLSIIDLAKLMNDKFPECNLEFDDIEFFTEKFENEFVDNYPTLFYFFNKNLLTYQQIKDNFIVGRKYSFIINRKMMKFYTPEKMNN